ncbi:hypothetical protein [Psychroserpens sp. Hel_I_66]|uniref:hypothetical protein n=1 Tax=Psychroserpens sp. Hel_I_66 TaxID=1250004 RepID=UPI000B105508|nr:hypothetical protein [Psychroserpens sp. Hel_I_66]
MKDWELDRIYIWIRAASIYGKNNGVKFLIDLNDKSLFNLILKDNEWKCVLNREIGVRYSKEQIEVLESKIESLKDNRNKILEFPKLIKSEIEYIEKTKLELERKKKYKVKFDWMKYDKIIYGNPAEFGIEWLKEIGIEIEELSRIGF